MLSYIICPEYVRYMQGITLIRLAKVEWDIYNTMDNKNGGAL